MNKLQLNKLQPIFSWLARFLEKTRIIMLNVVTAFVLIFFAIIIIGALISLDPEMKDPSGRVLVIDPKGTVVDQEVFNSDFLFDIVTDSSTDQIQKRDTYVETVKLRAEMDVQNKQVSALWDFVNKLREKFNGHS